jgi:alkylhydroperoxidase family enzyme
MSELLVRATRRGAQAQINHVAGVPARRAREPVATVYAQVERDFGMLAPPVTLHSPAPEVLAACWMMLRETLLAAGSAGRAAKEVVAAAVSAGNACPYCVAVHSTTLFGLIRRSDAVRVAEERFESIADPRLRRIAAWARASGVRAGSAPASGTWADTDGGVRPATVPFPEEQAAELVGVAVVFHYLNRMAHVFLDASPFPPALPVRLRSGLMWLVGRIMRPGARTIRQPGRSLGLLPAAQLPADLSWAAGSPHVAGSFARAAAAIEVAGSRSVPEAVRALVTTALAGWDGTAPGLSPAWVDGPVSELPPADRSAGRLALLTAMASYQVDTSVVEAFRRDVPGDRTLVELTSWASLAAARRAGGRLSGSLARYMAARQEMRGARGVGDDSSVQ